MSPLIRSLAAVSLAVGFAASSAPAQEPQRQLSLSKEERVAIEPLRAAIVAQDWNAAIAALPAAQAGAQGPDGRYLVGDLMLRIGLGRQDAAMQEAALDAIIASGGAPAEKMASFYRNQGALASRAGNAAKAEAAFARAVELSPSDPEPLIDLAKVKNDLKRPQEAVTLMERAIDIQRGAGRPVDESWYRYALKLAFDGRLAPQSLKLSRALVSTYPSQQNWRDALLIYRDIASLDRELELDLFRLAHAADALSGEREWYEYAETLHAVGLPAAAKAVLDEATERKTIDPAKEAFRQLSAGIAARLAADLPLEAQEKAGLAGSGGTAALRAGDALLGAGEHARAAALYRAASARGGVDSNLLATRLGTALALAGDTNGARQAFGSVAGPRADLAAFWLAWLARPAPQ